MMILYWNCQYCDYDEYPSDDGDFRVYGCTHPKNQEFYCYVNNQYRPADCNLLDEGKVNDNAI